MKRLLGLVALILVFFILAFFIGFGRIVSTTDGRAMRLGHLYLSLPDEAFLTLRRQVSAVTSLFHALPSTVTDALQAIADALGDLGEVFDLALQNEKGTPPPEGAVLV